MTRGAAGHLLDTHALIWWWLGDPALSKRAREVIAARTSPIHVSAVSGLEIALKVRAGKLPALAEPVEHFGDHVRDDDFRHLDIRHDHAVRAGLLPASHRDPFDRIIAAQAMIEGLTIITRDQAFEAFGCGTLW